MDEIRSAAPRGRPSPGIRVLVVGDETQLQSAVRELASRGSVGLAVERVGEDESGVRGPLRFARRLLVRLPGDNLLFLRSDEIDWIEAANQYVRIRTGKKSYLMRESMRRLESRLDPRRFARIHRSTIVNLERIRSLRTRPPRGRWAVLDDGSRLEVSQARWEGLRQALLDLA